MRERLSSELLMRALENYTGMLEKENEREKNSKNRVIEKYITSERPWLRE